MKPSLLYKFLSILLLLVIEFTVLPGLAQADAIIDNGDPETSSSGLWSVSGGLNPYGANSYWSRDGATYTWTFTPTESGNHDVAMWWTGYSSRSTSVPVDIEYSGGSERVYINQQQNGGQWNSLGQYLFQAGVSYDITITAQPGLSSTSADAVRFANVIAGTIIDNGDLQTSSAGDWNVSGGADPYGADSYWSRDGATYTWTFMPTVSGSYDLSMWWTYISSRSTSVPVEIEYMGGTDTFTINQQLNGGQWNLLGSYYFEAGISYNITITSPVGSSSTSADAVKVVYMSGNIPPVATIDSVGPNPALPGEEVFFSGSGTDSDGTITGYRWRSDIDGPINSSNSFSISDLSEGTHTIFFAVQNSEGDWSAEVNVILHYLGCDPPISIMPLGNSNTQGTFAIVNPPIREYATGYRESLFWSLKTAGYYFDFVGTIKGGELVLPAFDADHQGVGGASDDDIAASIYNWLVVNHADVVLLHIGTNNFEIDSGDVENILDEIDRYEADYVTDVMVVLARIINRRTYHPDTTLFNDIVQAMAENRIANGDKIIIVDQESALIYPDDMDDNIHANDTGYSKMADEWIYSLQNILPVCTQFAPFIYTTPLTGATAGLFYTYDAGSLGSPEPTYSLLTNPTGMIIDPLTGQIQWTPEEGQDGLHNVSVQAINQEGADIQNFTIDVTVASPIIDNDDSRTSSTGTWNISGGADPYGADSYWSRDGATYTWTFTPTVSGSYEVSMWWTYISSRTASVPVVIEYSGGADIVYVNQQVNGGRWNLLGGYSFQAGISYDITITAQAGTSSTCADAVKVMYAP